MKWKKKKKKKSFFLLFSFESFFLSHFFLQLFSFHLFFFPLFSSLPSFFCSFFLSPLFFTSFFLTFSTSTLLPHYFWYIHNFRIISCTSVGPDSCASHSDSLVSLSYSMAAFSMNLFGLLLGISALRLLKLKK